MPTPLLPLGTLLSGLTPVGPVLALSADELTALADHISAAADHLASVRTRHDDEWDAATKDGALAGLAFDDAGMQDHAISGSIEDVERRLRRAAEIVRAVAAVHRRIERYGETLAFMAGTVAMRSPLYGIALEYVHDASETIDRACAAEIELVCGIPLDPPKHTTHLDLSTSAAETDRHLRTQAPPELVALVDAVPDAHILEFSDRGAVLAVGDIDSAPSITTIVPGVNSSEQSGWGDYMKRAATLQKATGGATVLWLGYDAPRSVPHGTGSFAAVQAGPRLREFQSTLRRRARQRGREQRLVVLGHSYGSVVVGEAAKGPRARASAPIPPTATTKNPRVLAADAIVLAGSPGVHAATASELHTDNPTARVISASGDRDPIIFAASPRGGVHGPSPHAPGFGAERWGSSGDHSSYWNDPTFLRNMARLSEAR